VAIARRRVRGVAEIAAEIIDLALAALHLEQGLAQPRQQRLCFFDGEEDHRAATSL
jgi:hypothetical protein